MDNIIVIEDIFTGDDITSSEFNKLVINKIRNHPGWHLSGDEERENQSIESNFSDTGMLLESYYRHPDHNFDYHSDINNVASLIFDKILINLPFTFTKVEPVRFLWNYYNRSSTGVVHRDIPEKTVGNFCSIVYHLNDSDGQTVIDDESINSKSGQCVIFDSKKIHHGTGPTKFPSRYCLNIVFKYDKITD
jgi:hypothetical protein